jgi:hypothetical protein
METRTLLRDFQSHNQSRSVYTVENGLVCKSNKLRLLDFNIYTDSTYQTVAQLSLHPLAGVYSLIKKVSFLNLQGQEIDSFSNSVNNMALRLIHMDNGSQEGISNIINATNNSFFNTDSKSIQCVDNSASLAKINGLYIDLASMLNYLNTREYIVEGFTVVVEWNDKSVWAPSISSALYISAPTLALDEALNVSPQQVSQQPVMFINLVNDQILLGTSTTPQIRRLNSFYNQFISNLYYLNNVVTLPYRGLGFSASQGETFELTIDGKKLLPLRGIDTPARKMAHLHDFAGESNILTGSFMKLQNPLGVQTEGISAPTIVFDNNMSFGCIKLDRFIQNDMTLSYSRVNADNVNLFIVAEVLKMYDPKSGQLTYVKQ